MSEIQRWSPGWGINEESDPEPACFECVDGPFILHADIVKVFSWMVEHEVQMFGKWVMWCDVGGWKDKVVPDGDFLGAIVGLMGGDDE